MAAATWRCFLVHVAVLHFLPVLQAANVALGKTATLSSRAPHWNRAASLAVDGNTNTDFYAGSCVATAEEKDPWLRVDLGRKYLVKSVNLYLLSTDLFYVYFDHLEYPKSGMHLGSDKTFDECLELCRQDTANDCRKFVRRNWTRDNCWRVTTGRKYQSGEMYTQNKGRALANLKISVSNTVSGTKSACKTVTGPIQNPTALPYTCTQPVSGRYVWFTVEGDNNILSLCEVEVDGAFSYMANNPTYKMVTSQGFTVEWAACQFAENSQSTNRYKVEHTKAGSGAWNSYDVTGTSKTFTGRQHNTQYTVRVRCYWKDDKEGLQLADAYKEITIKTLCKDPVQVTIDAVTPTLAGQKQNPRADVALSWKPISNTDSGCDQITRYDVQYSKTGSSPWTTASPSGGIRSSTAVYTITDLEFNTQYKVRVNATNNDGKSSLGAEREATTKEGWSSAVQSLQHVAQSDSLSVTWQPPAHPRGTITRYTLSYQLTQRGTCPRVDGPWSANITVASTSYNLTGLAAYSEYRVRVVPVNGAGDGVETTIDARTAATVPSSPTLSAHINTKTARSVTFGWTAISCDKINDVSVHYAYTLQSIEYDNRTWTGTSHNVTLTARDLVPYALYSFTVTAVNNAGSSAGSDVIRVRTDEAEPLPPVDVSISDIRTDLLTVTWKTPTPPYGILQNYEIKYWTFNETARSNITSGNETYITLPGLESVTNYSIQVRGRTGAGWGNWSDVIYGFTEEGVPGEPSDFEVDERSTDAASFIWREPLVKNGEIIGYKVYCQNMVSGKVHFTETNALTETVEALSPGQKYSCFVSATTKKGYGDESKAIVVWTKPNKSSKPSHPKFKQMQATDTTLKFDLPSAQDGVTSYLMALDKEGGVSLKFRRKRQAVSEISKLGKCTGDVKKDDAYITAELSPNQVGQAFTIGDNKTYGSYRNCPLQTGKLYDVYYGAVVETKGGDRAVSFVKLQGAFKAKKHVPSGPDLATILGVVAAVLLFIIIIVVVVILYRRRKHLNSHKRRPEVVVFKDLEPIIEKSKEEDKNAAAVVEVDEADVDEDAAAAADLPEDVYENTLQPNERAIAVDFIPQHIKMNSKNENKGFQIEYKSCQKVLQQQREVGSKPENKNKNRFVNIMAYDHTRVVLDFVEGDPHSDYINACFISGYKSPKKFIASQGPTKYMTEDFWRMLWQYSIKRVVMVTNLVEKGIRKCEKYWPEQGSVVRFDDIDVQLTEETVYSDFTVRTLKASKDGKSKIVWQFHYTVWPDHGVPQNAASLLNFRRKVKSYDQISKGPIVVHCSAGVGRTGTFIATDILLEEAKAEQHVNFWACLKDMREQRVNMIQTVDQYIFVHTAVNEGIQAQECVYTPREFSAAYRSLIAKDKNTNTTKLSQQFKRLEVMSKKLRSKQRMSTINVANENSEKNRSPDIIPGAGCRPYLTSMVDARSDYINAVFIDGYKQKDAYIVTQMPLPDTIVDLWRLLLDHKSSTVVMLNQINHEDQTCQPYWPTDNAKPRHFPPFTVEHVTTDERNTDFVVRTVKLTHKTKLKETSKDVKIFQLVTWPEADATPSSTWSFLSLMDHVAEWQQQLPEKSPITVHCYDGARKSGLFVLASYVLEKLKLEQEIDVFNAARQIQVNRPQFLASEEQYRFCHTLLRDYLDSMSTYANFQ